MSRFLPLVILAIWLYAPTPAEPAPPALGMAGGLCLFVGVYASLLLIMRLWSGHVARRAGRGNVQRRLRRYNFSMFVARLAVPAWFAVGIFYLGWKVWVDHLLSPLPDIDRLNSPGLWVGIIPPFIAWMGLWWAQYPADLALREQNLLTQLEENLPIHTPPSFKVYLGINLRLQWLMTVAPALVLIFLGDVLSLASPMIQRHIELARDHPDLFSMLMAIPPAVIVLVGAPEIIRRVLQTEPMTDSRLRATLDEICRAKGIGYRNVLLWHTSHQMGNALVMGFLPRFRYILLSDLLMETMSDEQIEAIFAHEIGHVVHRHLWWLMGTLIGIVMFFAGPGALAAAKLQEAHHPHWLTDNLMVGAMAAAGIGLFSLAFGFISRKCERQADVFAARAIESMKCSVSPAGTEIYCSALARIAAINNIPIAARSWTHGSIASRIHFVRGLAQRPGEGRKFDRFMRGVFVTVAVLVVGSGVMAAWVCVNYG